MRQDIRLSQTEGIISYYIVGIVIPLLEYVILFIYQCIIYALLYSPGITRRASLISTGSTQESSAGGYTPPLQV